MAAQAQSVFKGVVVDVQHLPVKEGFAPQISITVRVDKALKGTPSKTITFAGNIFGRREDRFARWKESKAEFLWFDFGKRSDEAPAPGKVRGLLAPHLFEQWSAIRLSPPDPQEERLANHSETLASGTFGMDLRVYKDPKEILLRVEQFLSDAPGKVPLIQFMIPPELAQKTGFDAGDNRLVIPVTPASESFMRHLIDSPESVLGKDPSPAQAVWIRSHAVRVLSYFKSEKNIDLLKSLLTDAGKGTSEGVPFGGDAPRTYYWTRLAAYDVLKFWGVDVAMPDLR